MSNGFRRVLAAGTLEITMMRFMLAVALTLGIAACGGGGGDAGSGVTPLSSAAETPSDTGGNQSIPVVYDGNTLTVRAVRYERSPGIELCSAVAVCENGVEAYAPGQVIVSFTSANTLIANALLTSLGLSVNSARGDALIVSVPVLFERQWVRALQQEAVFTAVEVNAIIRSS
jgi:hypothetical protein